MNPTNSIATAVFPKTSPMGVLRTSQFSELNTYFKQRSPGAFFERTTILILNCQIQQCVLHEGLPVLLNSRFFWAKA